MQLNSNIKFQYIQLVRSPYLFNTTFTISIWLKPETLRSQVYSLVSQVYLAAPSLIISIIDGSAAMHIYGTHLRSPRKLKYSEWQYVTFVFDQQNLSMIIYIDGILSVQGVIQYLEHEKFEIKLTSIGEYDAFNQYNGLMDQLSIAFINKSNIDILDEATLVVYYNFEGDDQKNSFLFKDISANSIRAQGSNVSYLVGSRYPNQNTLLLYNPSLSYFQSGGFVLLSTYNYSYSYAVWLNVSSISSFMPLAHLVYRRERSSYGTTSDTCLAMLGINRTGILEFSSLKSLFLQRKCISI